MKASEVFQVTTVDKYHGRDKEVSVVTLPDGWLATKQNVGMELRRVRLLMSGQSVREIRNLGHSIVIFPKNAPGMTTGTHSITLHRSLGCLPTPRTA